MCEVETKDEKYPLRLLRSSLQPAKQAYIDRMNCRPVFGVVTHAHVCVFACMTALCVFQVG